MGLDNNPSTIILDDIFRSLGPTVYKEDFKDQIIGLIDMSLLPLTQVGALKDIPTPIGESTTWDAIINDPPNNHYNAVYAIKTYVYINVKLMFDPPASSVINVLEKRCDEMIWRIRLSYDHAKNIDGGDTDE